MIENKKTKSQKYGEIEQKHTKIIIAYFRRIYIKVHMYITRPITSFQLWIETSESPTGIFRQHPHCHHFSAGENWSG